MVLLGDLNWWLPGWLDRILPKMSLETASDPELDIDEEPVPVGYRASRTDPHAGSVVRRYLSGGRAT
jgi:RND superfamily putative drug exporter